MISAEPSASNTEFGLPFSSVTAALSTSIDRSPLCGMCRFGLSPACAPSLAAGRGERRLALADGVDVESVLTGRQALYRDIDQDAAWGLRQIGGADLLALGVLQ